MKIGSRIQYNKFKANNAHDPALLEKVDARIEWATPDIYFIREDTDGEKEAKLIEQLVSANNKPSDTTNLSLTPGKPTKIRQTTAFTSAPTKPTPISIPYKQPPPFLTKAMQYLITVTGPKVIESIFKMRFRKCTVEGGLTFALLNGTITDISPTFIYINDTGVAYPSDERPAVKIGDIVQHGQTLTTSDVAKQCPLLNAKDGQYFCGGCGCGARKKAELTNKLYYARVTCPRTPPQFSAEDENGPNIDQSK